MEKFYDKKYGFERTEMLLDTEKSDQKCCALTKLVRITVKNCKSSMTVKNFWSNNGSSSFPITVGKFCVGKYQFGWKKKLLDTETSDQKWFAQSKSEQMGVQNGKNSITVEYFGSNDDSNARPTTGEKFYNKKYALERKVMLLDSERTAQKWYAQSKSEEMRVQNGKNSRLFWNFGSNNDSDTRPITIEKFCIKKCGFLGDATCTDPEKHGGSRCALPKCGRNGAKNRQNSTQTRTFWQLIGHTHHPVGRERFGVEISWIGTAYCMHRHRMIELFGCALSKCKKMGVKNYKNSTTTPNNWKRNASNPRSIHKESFQFLKREFLAPWGEASSQMHPTKRCISGNDLRVDHQSAITLQVYRISER